MTPCVADVITTQGEQVTGIGLTIDHQTVVYHRWHGRPTVDPVAVLTATRTYTTTQAATDARALARWLGDGSPSRRPGTTAQTERLYDTLDILLEHALTTTPRHAPAPPTQRQPAERPTGRVNPSIFVD